MAGKRYYWLKLQVGFFQELIIKQLRTLPDGDSIVLLYLKLLLKAIRDEQNSLIKKYDSTVSFHKAKITDFMAWQSRRKSKTYENKTL